MTEERILEYALARIREMHSRHGWYCNIRIFSGLCDECGDVFFTHKPGAGGRFCSQKCYGMSQRGEKHRCWRGGRSLSGDGYVRVYVPTHPRGKVMLEHTVVMEKHIGRYLLPQENVHHKNGVRSDNRIENLELWASTQPGGQRVSDLIDYILAHHDDEYMARRTARQSAKAAREWIDG